MLTAPNNTPLEQFHQLFGQLMACSVAILNTPQALPDVLAPAIAEREGLIREISGHLDKNPELRKLDEVQAALQKLVAEDKSVLAHVEALQKQVGQALEQVHQSKTALGSYKFPQVDHSSGIENRG